MTTPISTIILTFNEEKHIERCILNARRFSKEIFVVDSFSTDNTIEIAKRLGAIVYQNKWEKNYARQFNWGLMHLLFLLMLLGPYLVSLQKLLSLFELTIDLFQLTELHRK